jgi:hypothetical protein
MGVMIHLSWEQRRMRRFQQGDLASFKMFLDKFLTCFRFLRIERINFGDFRDEVFVKFDLMVKGA